jgi:hypothetical protein
MQTDYKELQILEAVVVVLGLVIQVKVVLVLL